jgi:hypothetical protein
MSKSNLLAAGLALAHLTCAGVPLTAPSGSTISLNANPTFVPANGGVSAVTAIVVEPAGTFVPDGTVVFFLTDLGRIDAQGKTKDGFVRVSFVSDSRSGTAHVTAFSGGTAPAPAPSATPTPASVTASNAARISASSGPPVVAAEPISAMVPITIGSALPEDIVVTASPQRITEPRHTEITANVYDGDGNPVFNVPVIFRVVSSTGLHQEELDSGGQPRYTDTNGQARDTLRTRQNRADPQKEVTVEALVPGLTSVSGDVDVFIN